FAFGVVIACCDARLQIDDSDIAIGGGKQRQRVSPGPGPMHRMLNRAVHSRREIDVGASIAHHAFVEDRVSGVREDLVDASTEHHVTAEKQYQGGVPRWPPDTLGHPLTA